MSDSHVKSDIEEIKKALKDLTELELARAKLEAAKAGKVSPSIPSQPEVDLEELKADLRNCNLGELVVYAIKKDLIRRGPASED